MIGKSLAIGSLGLSFQAATIAVSFSKLESSLRVTSLVVGILVGVASFTSIIIGIYRNRKTK